MSSFDEFQERLRSASLRELLVLAGAGVNGLSFNAIAALRERFLDVAFHDEDLRMDDRTLAAAWARAIDSLLMLMLEHKSATLAGYLRAREASQEERVRFGYGSAGYVAAGRMLDASIEQLRQRHAQLLSIAFPFSTPVAPTSAA